MTWSLALALVLVPFYVGLICYFARPLKRYIARRWPNSFLLINWKS